MTDESKANNKKPDNSSEKIKEEQELQTQPKSKDVNLDDSKKTEKEPLSDDIEKQESKDIIKDNQQESLDETSAPKESDVKPVKVEDKKEKTKKEESKSKDFKYIVRISNTDVDGDKKVVYGLSSIKGVSVKMATIIADNAGVNRYVKIGDLKDSEIEKIQTSINNITNIAPKWMFNHRKDYETGKDIHLIGTEIDLRLRDEINIMKKIRSYRGIRHERGLPVRGQRTKANNRKGLALGVSKKKEQ